MYEAVQAYPAGDSTVARLASTAARLGYSGLVIRTRSASRAMEPTAIGDEYGIDVVTGVEIDADDPSAASGSVGNFRPDFTVLTLRGGSNALNRFAVESDRIDVLSKPMAGRGDVNHVLVKAAADHGVALEFDLGPVLRATGGRRVQALSDLRKLREIVDHYDAPYVVSATAASHLELRAPRELRAVGEAIGFDADAIDDGLRAWKRIAERNRHRLSESFVEPGVRRGRYGDDAGREGDGREGDGREGDTGSGVDR
ncbi:ribonuclease P/MRP protein subunit RPP1 [Halopenitus malekzadehii]|uniref:Ribonuclease P protein component 3 n=1 Tax=Halopenitus malekzadehii TaxID=1267564 RepID=A0A1H6HXM3_9EURY|nr:RNase P subunit p30 family protein [Halopenitus malekzadehii]SEH40995.1 ribonuclease P/MRP protein subunit RPP1 [Halopenitus malekzadehii]